MKSWFWCFFFFVCSAAAADKIGHVVALEGVLKAVGLDEVERTLKNSSSVFLGDTLITEEVSKGQIKFVDGTLILLIPGSRYSIDAYAESHIVGKNIYAARLTQGGARISTGLIAKSKPENFEVGTPNATIGVRGTVFETRVVDGDVYVGSSSGDLSVSNGGGTIDIGQKQENSFAVVSSPGRAPQALAQRPDALNLADFSIPSGGISFGGSSGGSAATAGGAAASGATGASASAGFAWGPAIGGFAVFGTVAGVTAGISAQMADTFSEAVSVFAHTAHNRDGDSNFSH